MNTTGPRRTAPSILIVDDERTILDLLSRILSEDGYSLTGAEDGDAALELIKQRDFDLVISDFRMPKLDGRQLFEGARAARPGIEKRFIFITGETDPAAKKHFIEEVGVGVITKPFRPGLVRAIVRATLSAG